MQYNNELQQLAHSTHRRVEAARYALLRRLAFAMRHNLVVHLQPIGMITEIMERRLQSPSPNLAQIRESMAKINGFSRAAVQSGMDVVSWLAPADGALVALDAGVQECLGLLRSHFSFRGFTVKDELGAAPLSVGRTGLRDLLPASLLALTDRAVSPADLVISAQLQAGQAVVSLTLRPTIGASGFASDMPYRPLEWHEVEALAQADGVGLERGANHLSLTFRAAGGLTE
jgi:hypothetical protein